MIKKLFSFLLFVSLSINANSQTFDPVLASELQNKIDSIRIANNIKGISVSVVYPGMGTWNGVSGVSHIGTPITSDMLFGIASNTKLFTGVLLLKLAESNFISLDDSLYEYLPTFNNIDSTITIRQLLNHTSGLDDVTSVPGYPDSMLTDPNRIFTASELITWAGPPQFAAGTSWSYCNTNYLLAGMIAESVTGISYSQLLRDSILTPLQLDSTFLDVYEPILYPVAQPWQGGFNNNSIPRTSVNSAAWAAGAMYSTSGEMVQWYNALMHVLVLNTNSFNEMTTFVGSGNYGIGICQATVIGRTVWTHGGSIWGGYSSNMMYDPSTGIIICVLINQFPAPAFQVSTQLLTSLINNATSISNDVIPESMNIVYPNPSSEIITIQFKELIKEDITACLYDLNGRLLQTQKIAAGCTIGYFDVRTLYTGEYILKCTNDQFTSQKRVTIIK